MNPKVKKIFLWLLVAFLIYAIAVHGRELKSS